MKAFLIRRILQTLITLFVVSLISFTLSMVLPGDPSLSIVGSEGASEAMIQNLRQELGLDQPIGSSTSSGWGRSSAAISGSPSGPAPMS